MKASFTNFLKIKWMTSVFLIIFGINFGTNSYAAECGVTFSQLTMTLSCDGSLAISINNPHIKSYTFTADGSGTTYTNSQFPLSHATGRFDSVNASFRLEIECVDGKSSILNGVLPAWSLNGGTGAGTYTFTNLGNPTLSVAPAKAGSPKVELVSKIKPSCPGSSNGEIWVQVKGSINPSKCEGAQFWLTMNGGSGRYVSINTISKFPDLIAGSYIFDVLDPSTIHTCPCGFNAIPAITIPLADPSGNTASLACTGNVNVTLSEECNVSVSLDQMLGTISDPCNPMAAMVDKIVVKNGNTIVASGSGTAIVTFNGHPFVNKHLTYEVHDTTTGNYCWGYLIIEDKSPPRLTCNDPSSMEVTCLEFTGSANTMLKALLQETDCSPIKDPVILQQREITDCDDMTSRRYLKMISVTYFAEDIMGNKSATCVDTLYVLRFDTIPGNSFLDIPGTIKFPPSFVLNPTVNQKDALYCHRPYPKDDNGNPAPIFLTEGGTSFPMLEYKDAKGVTRTSELFPVNFKGAASKYRAFADKNLTNCKIAVSYEDFTFNFGCKIKIQRTWYLREWSCEGEQVRTLGVQEIIIADHQGPIFTKKVPDQKFSVNSYGCSKNLTIPLPTLYDSCSNTTLEIAIFDTNWNVIGPRTGSPNSFDFPLGMSLIVYSAFDACHNVTRDTAKITVEDWTPPVVICKEFLVVGLSVDGTVRVPASAFNNGSYDDCNLASTCVVRMDDMDKLVALDTDGDGKVLYSAFQAALPKCERDYSKYTYRGLDGKLYVDRWTICTPDVWFCCSDNTNQDIMVIFRAYDAAGNSNECMVFVDLQDKSVPEITCPSNVTVDCRLAIPNKDTLDKINGIFVKVSRDPLVALFGSVVDQSQQKAFGVPAGFVVSGTNLVDGVFFDNCAAPQIWVKVETNIDQCGQGSIKRTFQAIDIDGNKSKLCTQTITIQRFNIEASIKWPDSIKYINEGCMDPNELAKQSFGEPVIPDEVCSLLGVSVENQIFRFNTNDPNNDACFKIIRKFTVIDWCKTHNGIPVVIGTFTQIIKVSDPIGPTLTCNAAVTKKTTNCDGDVVTLGATATDLCTTPSDLIWTARIDADTDNNGSFDKVYTNVSIVKGANGKVSHTGTYPLGKHKITWTVSDQCGNRKSCEQNFTILFDKAPTPFAINISTVLMQTGMVEVWASDLNNKTTLPCNLNPSNLTISIVRKGGGFANAKPSIIFTCKDTSKAGIEVDFYASYTLPDGSVLRDYTTVNVKIQDNNKVCQNAGTSAIIKGNIKTEFKANVPNIYVDLKTENQGASTTLNNVMTDKSGNYAFPEMIHGGSYKIDPTSTDDYLHGVSTLDLVMIQKYILGLYELDSPYKIVAADINNDKKVTALDLVDLRSVILGFNTKFSNNESWKFIDEAYKFVDPKSPLSENLKKGYDISLLNSDMNVNFIGVKIADVNGSVDAASTVAKNRSNVDFSADEKMMTSGTRISVPIKAGDISEMIGMQFSMSFDRASLKFSGIESSGIILSAANIGTNRIQDGTLMVSWNEKEAIRFGQDDELFVLNFEVLKTGKLSESLSLNSKVLSSEAYTGNLETINLGLTFNKQISVEGEYTLKQNAPNPFSESTVIEFSLPKSSVTTLTIHDVTGKQVYKSSGTFKKGVNSIRISNSELSATGIMYYTLSTDEFTDTKRMVVLK